MRSFTSVMLRAGTVLLLAGACCAFAQVNYSLAQVSVASSSQTVANGINNNGQIVGYYVDTGGVTHGFLLDTNGQSATIDFTGAASTVAYGINDGGTIVGYYTTANQVTHGFVRAAGGAMTQIDYPGATQTWAYGVNTAGTIVGAYVDNGGTTHAFIRSSAGDYTSFDATAPSGQTTTGTIAYAINNTGNIAGTFQTSMNTFCGSGFLRAADGTMTPFATAYGACNIGSRSETVGPVALNDQNQVVVSTRSCSPYPSCTTILQYGDPTGTLSQVTLSPSVPLPLINGLNGTTIVGSYDPAANVHKAFMSATCGAPALDTPSASFGASGGSGSLGVTSNNSCLYSLAADSWIHITQPATGAGVYSGSQAVLYDVTANDSATARNGAITVGSQSEAISQASGTCSYTAGLTSTTPGTTQNLTANGYSGNAFYISTGSSCSWSASTQSTWISTAAAQYRTGSGGVYLYVQPNTGAARTGVVTVAGITLTVNQAGTTNGGGGGNGSTFFPVAPCRVMDTREGPPNFPVPYGSPTMDANTSRSVPIAGASCGVPAGATAVSLNVTVVPSSGLLSYLTLWPTGSTQPFVSTLNSTDGRIVANSAIVPTGDNGAVSIYVTDKSDVVVDVNGYFSGDTTGLLFTSMTPCRAVDTRNATGDFGGPSLTPSASTRSFAIPNSPCAVSAPAYVFNVTAVPDGGLYFLTAWPTGSTMPTVSTLNSLDGDIVANNAVIPSGAGNAVSFYAALAGQKTDVVLDLNGYFSTQGALHFYPVAPCRVADTRGNGFTGAFGAPSLTQATRRTFPIYQSACGIPNTAVAYSMNFTVVPSGPLYYLSVVPLAGAGGAPVTTSTLNSLKGRIVSNSAIMPAGNDGSGSIEAAIAGAQTDLVIDINGYFAP